jgi:Flp pilus assembly protein TadG
VIAFSLRQVVRDRRGAALTEFGFVAPVLMLFLVGAFDIAHSLYLRSVMHGAIQKSARDSTLERNATPAEQALIDARVQAAANGLTFGQQIQFTRFFYRTFERAAAAQAEQLNDTNSDGQCNNNESYSDDNNNRTWDRNGGSTGQGLAFDRAVYTAEVTYPRLFPLWRFIGGSSTSTVQVRTVLMNQPYTGQGRDGTPTPRTCP